MLEILKDLWAFMRTRKKYWLLPIIIVLLLFGLLIVFTQGSVVAPSSTPSSDGGFGRTMTTRIAGIQMAPGPDGGKNAARAVELASVAAEKGAKIIAFPELCLTPWFLRDEDRTHFSLARPSSNGSLEPFLRASKDLQTVLVLPFFESSVNGSTTAPRSSTAARCSASIARSTCRTSRSTASSSISPPATPTSRSSPPRRAGSASRSAGTTCSPRARASWRSKAPRSCSHPRRRRRTAGALERAVAAMPSRTTSSSSG